MIGTARLVALFTTITALASNSKERPSMEITRKAALQSVPGPEQFFTGKVTVTGQFQRPEPSRVSGAIVHFEPNARIA